MLYLRLIIFLVGGNVSVDSEMLLMTCFVNLKISRLSLLKILIGVGCAYVYSYG
jgi:hypothetical protein